MIRDMSTIVTQILDRALQGEDITSTDAITLLAQTAPESIDQIRVTADRLRQEQVGDTVTYIINRNINFTNNAVRRCW